MVQTPDPHGHAALMLCESLMLLLVEEGLVRKDLVIDAVERVVNVSQDVAATSESFVVSITSIGLLRSIVSSLLAIPQASAHDAAHEPPPS